MPAPAHLASYALHPLQGEVRCLARIPVVLLELIQIGAQQFTYQDEMLLHTCMPRKWRTVCSGNHAVIGHRTQSGCSWSSQQACMSWNTTHIWQDHPKHSEHTTLLMGPKDRSSSTSAQHGNRQAKEVSILFHAKVQQQSGRALSMAFWKMHDLTVASLLHFKAWLTSWMWSIINQSLTLMSLCYKFSQLCRVCRFCSSTRSFGKWLGQ